MASTVVVTGADPAAGSEASVTVGAGRTLEILTFTVVCVQGLTQTPQPLLVVDDGTTTVFEGFGASAAQSVSTTVRYTWAPELILTALIGTTPNIRANAALPRGLILPTGYRLRTNTLGIGANTDYGVPAILAREVG